MDNMAIFYDTETTGLPLFSQPSEDPGQPNIVQIAALLVDMKSRSVVSSMDVIVRPNGWEIPDDVSCVHGITTGRALEVGVSEELALKMFCTLYNGRLRIAHNEPFDARIIRIALMRYPGNGDPDTWKSGYAHCTQALSTPILKLPPTERMLAAGFNKHKSANLREAYKHFTGLDLQNAHNAMEDVKATVAVYFAIMDMKK